MEVQSVFVTGANRGIGLEFVRQLVKLPKPPRFVFATYRNVDTRKELKDLREASKDRTQILLIKMDVTNLNEVRAAKKIAEDMVGDSGLNLLICNAGYLKTEEFPNITEENMILHFKTNTVAPVIVFQEFLPLLQKAADHPSNKSSGMSMTRAGVLNISSLGGSIAETGGSFPRFPAVLPYKTSKAGLNMAMRDISTFLKEKEVLVVQMCPGWVKTDMGGDMAQLEPSESISTMLKTLSTLNESHHGSFVNRHGNPIAF